VQRRRFTLRAADLLLKEHLTGAAPVPAVWKTAVHLPTLQVRAVSRNCPGASELATRCASDNTLTAIWSCAPDLHRDVITLQATAYLLRSSAA